MKKSLARLLIISSILFIFLSLEVVQACPADYICPPTYHPKTKAGMERQARRAGRVEKEITHLFGRYKSYCHGAPTTNISPFSSNPYTTVGKCFFIQYNPVVEILENNLAIVKVDDVPPVAIKFNGKVPAVGTLLQGVIVGYSVKTFINGYHQVIALPEFKWSHFANIGKLIGLNNKLAEIYSEKPLSRAEEIAKGTKLLSLEIGRKISRFLIIRGKLNSGCRATIHLSRSGEIIGSPKIIGCSKSSAIDDDIKNAILKSGPFHPIHGVPYSIYNEVIISLKR